MTELGHESGAHTPRWGMVIDINRCVGCQTCTIACKHTNDTPPGVQWRKVLDVEQGVFPDVQRLFLVVGCQHCAEPPCVPVCPTGATKQRADGLVTMDYDTCIGCGYCAVACPYQARTIVHDKKWFFGQATEQEIAVAHDERLGVANKCTFCQDRIDDGMARGLTPGVDPAATPACASSCIAQAIQFGDFKDPQSHVSELLRERASFQMHQELGTDPQIKYIYEAPATPGRDLAEITTREEALRDAANPLVGERQTFWDLRAAMNFTMGGLGSGLAVAAYLLSLVGALSPHWLVPLYLAAAASMAVGLAFVFMEIGRKMRFLLALLRPQTSWMTRETYAVAAFYPLVLADWIWPGALLHALVAVAAAAFLYCQARILHAGKGIPAWRVDRMPMMLLATGLYEGLGAVLIWAMLVHWPLGVTLPVAALVLAAVNAYLWRRYVGDAEADGLPPLARDELQKATPVLHIVGHGAVAAFALVALLWPGAPAFVIGLAGLCAIAGGAFWKYTVIVNAAFQQGYAVPKVPQRGSGTMAAPPRFGYQRA